ncbi:hypothetical protein HN51_022642 [Arachis hypogaea]
MVLSSWLYRHLMRRNMRGILKNEIKNKLYFGENLFEFVDILSNFLDTYITSSCGVAIRVLKFLTVIEILPPKELLFTAFNARLQTFNAV